MPLLKSQRITPRLTQFGLSGLRRPITRSLLLLAVCAPTGIKSSVTWASERPTLNHTADPRPDILPRPFYYAHTEYRRAYNRPRYTTGWIADKIAPTSQEALVWQENVQAGRYNGKHCPPVYKTYYYPKPWEALQTGPRPDFAKLASQTPPTTEVPEAFSRDGTAILPAPAGNIEPPSDR